MQFWRLLSLRDDARVSYHRKYNAPRIAAISRSRANTISFLRKENRRVSVSVVCIFAYVCHNFQIRRSPPLTGRGGVSRPRDFIFPKPRVAINFAAERIRARRRARSSCRAQDRLKSLTQRIRWPLAWPLSPRAVDYEHLARRTGARTRLDPN